MRDLSINFEADDYTHIIVPYEREWPLQPRIFIHNDNYDGLYVNKVDIPKLIELLNELLTP